MLRSELAAEGVTEQEQIDAALEDDAVLEDLRDLADARRQQREDYVAFGLFLLFLSGADAYVSAHLADFPTPIAVNAQPAPSGGIEIAVRVPFGN